VTSDPVPFKPKKPGRIGGGISTSTFVAIVAPLLACLAVGLALVSPSLHIRIPFLSPGAPPAAAGCTGKIGPPPAAPYIGVAPGKPWKANLKNFSAMLGYTPQIVEAYQTFPAKFPMPRACLLAQEHILPLIQWNPRVSMAAIADGRYDSYLNRYAQEVKNFGHPVVLSFAHEMNGEWYSWGYTHTSPQVFIAAWQHVHTVLEGDGASNVIWLWDVNRDTHLSQPSVVSPPQEWYPGPGYVDWLGIDGYFNSPDDAFSGVFDKTLADFRAFPGLPVLVTETAVAKNPVGVTQINSLFAGVRHHGLLGLVWFDQDRRETWKLEGRVKAVAAFRQDSDVLLGKSG
jgi:mannan endo-1,4-beta-mannosidase